jgi:dTDP-4-amino-4,6-dideoxygalactose transaminase
VVEDAAQAVRAELQGRRAGAWGAAGCFSLHPLKNLNVAGDGGMLTTNDPELYAAVKKLRNHGLRNRDEVEFFGFNSRLDNLQAVVGLHQLGKLEEVTARRRANAALYDQLLGDLAPQVVVPPRDPEHFQVFHTYVVQVERREELREHLAQQGVDSKIHYPIPIHLQRPCRELGHQEGDFPVCENQACRILTLPVHQHLRPAQVRYVADQIARFYRVG